MDMRMTNKRDGYGDHEADSPIGLAVDARVERLIVRHLDGEISPAEQRELDAALQSGAAARELLNEYRTLDVLAKRTLRADLAGAKTAAAPRHVSGFRLATVSMLATAAAVVVFSFLPDLWRGGEPDSRTAARPAQPRAAPLAPSPMQGAAPAYVEYRNDDFLPKRRQRDVMRDVIGIRGDDPNVIYVFERNTRATRVEPIVADF